jgi:hypothetical protein
MSRLLGQYLVTTLSSSEVFIYYFLNRSKAATTIDPRLSSNEIGENFPFTSTILPIGQRKRDVPVLVGVRYILAETLPCLRVMENFSGTFMPDFC